MSDFTYELPFSEDKLLEIIIKELKQKGKHKIAYLLKNAKIFVKVPGTFSYYIGGGRWNALAAYIQIYVNPDNIEILNENTIKDEIKSICDYVIPANVGYDIKDVSFYPDYSIEHEVEEDLVEDLVKTSKSLSKRIIEILPPELMNKALEMVEAYVYMYVIENTLRLFIEKVCIDKYGENYFDSIKKTKAIIDKVEQRKKKYRIKEMVKL